MNNKYREKLNKIYKKVIKRIFYKVKRQDKLINKKIFHGKEKALTEWKILKAQSKRKYKQKLQEKIKVQKEFKIIFKMKI